MKRVNSVLGGPPVGASRVLFGWAVLCLVLAAATATSSAASVHSSRAQGTGMNTSYLSDGLSTVNLYNGNLSMAIPLFSYPAAAGMDYGLTLVYNSNVWDWNNAMPDVNGQVPPPDPYVYDISLGISIAEDICVGCDTHNAGAGWRVSFGAFWPRSNPPINDNDQYLLIESDGTRRLFYQTLHEGEAFQCDQGTANETCEKGWYLHPRRELSAGLHRTVTDRQPNRCHSREF